MNEKALLLGEFLPSIAIDNGYLVFLYSYGIGWPTIIVYKNVFFRLPMTALVASYDLLLIQRGERAVSLSFSALVAVNLNIHFHILFSDGVYCRCRRGRVRFKKARALEDDDIEQFSGI